MTGQSLLDRMELVNQELQLQSGEADVTRGLIALNVAQDYFEQLAALRKGIKGGATGTLTTSASTETTTFPTGVLRIDALFLLDSNSRPTRKLDRLSRTGGHREGAGWPQNLFTSNSTGEPSGYWTDGTNIYWQPLPSGVSSVRWYGFQRASDITAVGTFAYEDGVAFPLAAFAARLMKTGVDDSNEQIAGLAQETFKSVLDTLEMFNRDGAANLAYTEVHNA